MSAKLILDSITNKQRWINDVAEIIDRETAAPELLQACKALVDALARYGDDVDEEAPSCHVNMMESARAAIAKAEGKQ